MSAAPSIIRWSQGFLLTLGLLCPLATHASGSAAFSFTDESILKKGPATVSAGGTITYSIAVTYAPQQHSGMSISDSFPAGLQFDPGASTEGCVQQAASIVCTWDDHVLPYTTLFLGMDLVGYENFFAVVPVPSAPYMLGVAESPYLKNIAPKYIFKKTIDLVFNVPQDMACKTLTNTATLPQSPYDGNTQNNTSTVVTKVNCPPTPPPPPATGCIEIIKETFNTVGQPITPVAQFTFRLEDGQMVTSDSLGRARFLNVPSGPHTVSEQLAPGWLITSITPLGGSVIVPGGTQCATVVFKNKQNSLAPTPTPSPCSSGCYGTPYQPPYNPPTANPCCGGQYYQQPSYGCCGQTYQQPSYGCCGQTYQQPSYGCCGQTYQQPSGCCGQTYQQPSYGYGSYQPSYPSYGGTQPRLRSSRRSWTW